MAIYARGASTKLGTKFFEFFVNIWRDYDNLRFFERRKQLRDILLSSREISFLEICENNEEEARTVKIHSVPLSPDFWLGCLSRLLFRVKRGAGRMPAQLGTIPNVSRVFREITSSFPAARKIRLNFAKNFSGKIAVDQRQDARRIYIYISSSRLDEMFYGNARR